MSKMLNETTVDMFEKTRTRTFIEELQKEMSEVLPFATLVNTGKGKFFQLPAIGSTELDFKQGRHSDIVATELPVGRRNMRPIYFSKWLSLSTDDENFLDNLPINLTTYAKQLANAAARKKDEVLMGTCEDGDAVSETFGEFVVRRAHTVQLEAEDGSPYKGGTESGIFGDAYIGEFADVHVPLPQQPMLVGEQSVTESYLEMTDSATLDLKRTNVIPANFVMDGDPVLSGFSEDKFLAAVNSMRARRAKGTLVMALTPRQALDVQRNPKFQNSQFGYMTLKDGMLDSLMGVKILVTDAIPLVNVAAEGETPVLVRSCPMWLKEDLIYGMWEESPRFIIKEPDEKESTMYVGTKLCMGAARKRDETFICIHCDEGRAS